jgi:regulator of sigma E protease
MSYLLSFFLLSLLVLVHELGHLLAARSAGIPVAAFSVGMGPKLWSRRFRGTEYSLRALPFGGFVLAGVESFEEMQAIPLARRLVFFLGGPAANLILALPLCAALNLGQKMAPFRAVLVEPFLQLGWTVHQVVEFIPSLFQHPDRLNGVVGIVATGGQMLSQRDLLTFTIGMSVSLGLLNLLPIPILDGGQIVLGCLERLFPRVSRLRPAFTVAGALFLVAVMVYANGRDVWRLWGAA